MRAAWILLVLVAAFGFAAPNRFAPEDPRFGGASAVTINQTGTIGSLFPGGPPLTLSGTFTNTGFEPVTIKQVTAAVTGVRTLVGTCEASDLALTNPIMQIGRRVPAGNDVETWGGATIQLLNRPQLQGCQSAVIDITYTAS